MPSSSHLGASYSVSNKSIWEIFMWKSTRVIQVKWISLRYGSECSTRDWSLKASGSSSSVWFSVAPDGRSQTVPLKTALSWGTVSTPSTFPARCTTLPQMKELCSLVTHVLPVKVELSSTDSTFLFNVSLRPKPTLQVDQKATRGEFAVAQLTIVTCLEMLIKNQIKNS